jgi:hypothetical protein
MSLASLLFWLIRPSFARSHGLSASIRGTAFQGSDRSALLGTSAPDIFLDGVEAGNTFERFAGDRCRTGDCELIELAPNVRAAESKVDFTRVGQLAVAGIAIRPEECP